MAQDVFLFLEEKRASERVEAIVKVTYMELYREELRDLLDVHPNQKELHIREDKRGNTGNMPTLQNYYFLFNLTVWSQNFLSINPKHIWSCGSHLPVNVFNT